MSELKLLEFRERALDGVEAPDFSGIERRGRGLRRRRLASAAGATALVLAAGAGIVAAAGSGSPDTAPPPAGEPSESPSLAIDPGVQTRIDAGEAVLRRGRSTATYDGFTVSFDVRGPRWEWWDNGMGKRWANNTNDYDGAVFIMSDPAARQKPCSAKKVRTVGRDPDALIENVQPLLDLAGTRVLQAPEVMSAFGGTAVHLRLETRRLCADDFELPDQLQTTVNGVRESPGFGGTAPIDLWHIVIPGPSHRSVLVASWDLGGSDRQQAEQRALLDSMRIEPTD